MRTIAVEDDVYNLLVEKIMISGETPSAVLRKMLDFGGGGHVAEVQTQSTTTKMAHIETPISEFVGRSEFLVHPDVVSRYLGILSWLHGRNPEDFKKIAAIGGRKRKYFGLTHEELDAAGRMVMPKRIPNSLFWAVTNNSTALKRKILDQVMRVLGYSSSDIGIALSQLK